MCPGLIGIGPRAAFLVAAILATAPVARAASPCDAKPTASGAETNACLAAEQARWTARLAQASARLEGMLGGTARDRFKASEQAWTDYRAKDLGFIEDVAIRAAGSAGRLNIAKLRLAELQDRVFLVESYVTSP
jgi:hypothetical protein